MSEQIHVRIERLVYGGDGLAHLSNGKAVFVRGVLPGELVLASLIRRRKGVFEAIPLQILEPSPERISPPCGSEEQCTGATWPHIAYPAQLRLKEEILIDTLKRTGGISSESAMPILPSPSINNYRLRTQFNVRIKNNLQRIGFFRHGSSDLVEVENSFLLHPLINRTLAAVRRRLPMLPPLEEVHINASPAGEVHILLFAPCDVFPQQNSFFDDLRRDLPEIIGITGFSRKKKVFSLGRNYLTLDLNGITFHATEGNFFQVNWEQNKNMVKTVLDFAELSGKETVLDLYCGIGNFALFLARRAEKVIGIESGYSAIDDARKNAALNNIQNAEFIAEDLQKGLKSLIERKMRADVIVLDPPRAGATLKTLERILAFVPRKIIYVSCNPATLARDLKFFNMFGFRLHRLQPIDMFPWTYHIECVAEMVRERPEPLTGR